jgi:hypothetical protein
MIQFRPYQAQLVANIKAAFAAGHRNVMAVLPTGGGKTCSRCKATKPVTEFTKASSRKDGLNPWCKDCTRANCKKADPEKTKERSAAWYANNKERRRETTKEWLRANPGKAAEYCQKWRSANPDKSSEANAVWYAKNRAKKLADDKSRREKNLQKFLERERASYLRNKASALAKNAKWRESNGPRIAAHAAKRRTAKSERTPLWLSVEQHEAILAFYIEAARVSETTGIPHHVDHIVPLRGKTVSGLHVPWNLQIISATENLKKSNRHAT